jgi:hypothetical protein
MHDSGRKGDVPLGERRTMASRSEPGIYAGIITLLYEKYCPDFN